MTISADMLFWIFFATIVQLFSASPTPLYQEVGRARANHMIEEFEMRMN